MKEFTAKYLYKILLIASLHALFFLYTWYYGNPFAPDSYDYITQAENILNEGSIYSLDKHLPFNPDYLSRRPPVYGLFLAAIKTLDDSLFTVLLVQNILSCLSLVFLIAFVKKNFGIVNSNLKFLLWMLLLPGYMLFANKIMSEWIFGIFISWASIFYVQWYRSEKKLHFAISQLFLIAGECSILLTALPQAIKAVTVLSKYSCGLKMQA